MKRLASRWERVSPGARDALFAGILTAVTQFELLSSDSIEGSMAVQSASFAAMTISVAWRRSSPLLAAGLVAGGLVVQTLAGEAPIAGGFIAVLIVMYSVASYSELRVALGGGLMILAAAFLYPVIGDVSFSDEVVNAFLLVGPWVFGRSTRNREARALEAEAETIRVSVESDAKVAAAVADERGRIARDMHDVVAHGVSMMVLQTGAARQVIVTDPDRSRELLLNVENSGRDAMSEMHLMLDVLRAPPVDIPVSATALNIAALDDLAKRASAPDSTVTFDVQGSPRRVSPGLEAAVYRITQEALTNAMRHGNAANVDVVVTYEDAALTLTITDDGTVSGNVDQARGGNGLIGMKERTQLFSGHLSAGPRSPGPGWIVVAELPTTQPA
ncbi:MAG: sensor histidine kinase [Acidimicrobiia bacterium]